jgi:HSP20 family protein
MLRGRVRLPGMARRDIDRLQGEIEELFADLWQVPRFTGLRHGFRPAVDCFHTDEPHQLTIVVELAGVDPESVAVAIEERALTISGERRRPRVDGQVYQQMEIEYGAFSRTLNLLEDVDGAAAGASFERGLLTVTLPIAERPPRPEPVAIVVVRTP